MKELSFTAIVNAGVTHVNNGIRACMATLKAIHTEAEARVIAACSVRGSRLSWMLSMLVNDRSKHVKFMFEIVIHL